MLKKSLIAAVVCVWVISTPAAGGIISAKFLGVDPGKTIYIKDSSTAPPLSTYTSAGVFNLKITHGTNYFELGQVGDIFQAFCIDLGNSVAKNHVYTWEVVHPTAAPTPDIFSDGPISAGELLALQKLLGAFPIASLTTGKVAAAMQAAVWEIVNEATGVYDVTVGDFIAGGGGLDATLANHMLSVSAGYQGPLPILGALRSQCAQDLLVVIPEPATFVTLVTGIGFAALGWRRRRR